jgi:hypothetical protein
VMVSQGFLVVSAVALPKEIGLTGRHNRGRRLPALVFLPILWMAMTNVIMVPTSAKCLSPISTIQELGSQLYCFGQHSCHRMSYLDEMMVLDLGTWLQFNTLKATDLCQMFAMKSPLTECNSKGGVGLSS